MPNRDRQLHEFSEAARAAIAAWMANRRPPVKQQTLAKMLGYADATTLSRVLRPGGRPVSGQFLERLAACVPDLAYLFDEYYAIRSGATDDRGTARKQDLVREISELEEKTIDAVRRAFEIVRRNL